MSPAIDQNCTFLDELDARQDDLLLQLDQLNTRIETLLGQFTAASEPPLFAPVEMPRLANCPQQPQAE